MEYMHRFYDISQSKNDKQNETEKEGIWQCKHVTLKVEQQLEILDSLNQYIK